MSIHERNGSAATRVSLDMCGEIMLTRSGSVALRELHRYWMGLEGMCGRIVRGDEQAILDSIQWQELKREIV